MGGVVGGVMGGVVGGVVNGIVGGVVDRSKAVRVGTGVGIAGQGPKMIQGNTFN